MVGSAETPYIAALPAIARLAAQSSKRENALQRIGQFTPFAAGQPI